MLINGDDLKNQKTIKASVCILGGGVAGLTLAKELKESFSDIVLLESGSNEYTQQAQNLYKANSVSPYYPDTSVSRLRFLGGASNHWANNTSPFTPIDFEMREWIDNSGWPITFDDISPYYKKAAQYCGTGDDGYLNDYWFKLLNQKDSFSSQANIETMIAKAALPPTRFFYAYGEELAGSHNVTIYKNSNVVDIDYSSSTAKITKVYFENYNGIRHSVEADYFVVCFGGIENARMMLLFNEKYNNKLGNKFDNVGRYFMDHPMVSPVHVHTGGDKTLQNFSSVVESKAIVSFYSLTEKALKNFKTTNIRLPLGPASEYELSDGISSFHILNQSFAKGKLPDDFGSHLSNFVMDMDMVIEAISRKSFDTPLFESANDFDGFNSRIMLEQAPHRDNQIKLGNTKDSFGIPRVDIKWELKAIDRERLWRSLEVFSLAVGEADLGRVRLLKERSDRLFGDQMGFGHHHMGTTRMWVDESKGVVDGNQKVFGTNNLYIAGSSVFTTGSHVPPTLTIVAMTIRLAEHIKGLRS